MKLKCFKNGILKNEEELGKGWIARVSYKGLNITNVDLSNFTSVYEKTIEIESDTVLKIIINDAPFLHSIYDIMDGYKGLEIVDFKCGEIQVVIEW